MIFKQWRQVLDGTKTQTRRPVKQNEVLDHQAVCGDTVYITDFVSSERIKWQMGRTYAIQPGRGKKAVGRILITRIRREKLGEINHRDSIAEGIERFVSYPGDWRHQGFACPICAYSSRSWTLAFAHLWNHVYGNGAWHRMKDDDVWVLDFEVAGSR